MKIRIRARIVVFTTDGTYFWIGNASRSIERNFLRTNTALVRRKSFRECAYKRVGIRSMRTEKNRRSLFSLFSSFILFKIFACSSSSFSKTKIFLSLSLSLENHQVEEFYVLTWEAKKEQIFEMPTGGAAIMRKGPNLLKLARKEQCMALVTTFRAKKIANGCIYRVFPSGEVQYLHPKDGVYPEKVNAGRVGVNQNMRSIGKNTNPVNVKFQGQGTFDV